MTGTAGTEADEFQQIYKLEVVEIPTNVPVARVDQDDEVYRSAEEKYEALIGEIERAKARKQPVLVGTASIEKSEYLAELLKKNGFTQIDLGNPEAIKALYDGDQGSKGEKLFAVLNARYHEQEAVIVAQAGLPGAVTIATNMAGRGTDIQLGGNVEMRIRWNLPICRMGRSATQPLRRSRPRSRPTARSSATRANSSSSNQPRAASPPRRSKCRRSLCHRHRAA